ncbi:MAG: GTPase domain-containing protein, partial [Neisseria sp.]|nr:GTPase domain-containing protein [Neisseria sp.]
MTTPLSLAVVGHTNTGKTSLLRTLLRDSTFGEVKNAPSTTRHVEEALINDGDDSLVYLYDTPGLEDAGGVLDWLETHTSARDDGIERIQQFLNSHESHHEFNQEAKVLRQVMQSDMAMY